jgi:hypothetical protein
VTCLRVTLELCKTTTYPPFPFIHSSTPSNIHQQVTADDVAFLHQVKDDQDDNPGNNVSTTTTISEDEDDGMASLTTTTRTPPATTLPRHRQVQTSHLARPHPPSPHTSLDQQVSRGSSSLVASFALSSSSNTSCQICLESYKIGDVVAHSPNPFHTFLERGCCLSHVFRCTFLFPSSTAHLS